MHNTIWYLSASQSSALKQKDIYVQKQAAPTPHLLTKLSEGSQDFQFLLCVHVPPQLPNH